MSRYVLRNDKKNWQDKVCQSVRPAKRWMAVLQYHQFNLCQKYKIDPYSPKQCRLSFSNGIIKRNTYKSLKGISSIKILCNHNLTSTLANKAKFMDKLLVVDPSNIYGKQIHADAASCQQVHAGN